MGYLKSVGTAVIYIGLFLAVITFLPGLPPDGEFAEYSIKYPKELSGELAQNDRLNGAEILYKGQLHGPESFDVYKGEIYSGIHGGYVVRLEEKRVLPLVKFGKRCDGVWQEDKCGRPLGLMFDKKGTLYVVDTYYGIFALNVETKQYKLIVNISEPIEGKVPLTPNSIDIAANGDIYWTDSSTYFRLYDGFYSFLPNPSGRLIRYNAATKKNEVLVNNLAFANGVKLSKDESFVIAAETLTSRIVKYYLKGPKAGQKEYLVEGLPGIPDNIHSDGQDGFLVSLVLYVDSQSPLLAQSVIPHPYIRKMTARLLALIEAPFKLLQDIYPNLYTERFIHFVGSFPSAMFLDTVKKVVVLRISPSGEILEAAYSSDQKIHGISSAFVHKNYLWLGSPFNDFVARVPLKQAFPSLAQTLGHASNAEQKRVKESESAKAVPKSAESATTKTTKQNAPPPPPSSTAKPSTTSTTATTTTTTTTTTVPPTTAKPVTSPPPKPTVPPSTTKRPVANEIPVTETKTASGTNKKPSAGTDKSAKSSASSKPNTASKTENEVKKDTVKTSAAPKKEKQNSKPESAKETPPKVNPKPAESKNAKPENSANSKTQSGSKPAEKK